MKKKTLLILFTLIAILFINTISFASDNMKNNVHNVTDGIIDGITTTTEKARNGVNAAENTIENAVRDVGDGIRNTEQNMENTYNNGYNAARLATDDTTAGGMNNSTWSWIIIAIAFAVIIGVIWYYVTQNNNIHE